MKAPATIRLVFHHRRGPVVRFLLAGLVGFALALSCDDPQSPPPTPTGDGIIGGRYDPVGGQIEFELQSSDGSPSPLRLVASNLRYDETSLELAADVVVHNPGARAVFGPPFVLLSEFNPANVEPRNALPMACPECVGCPCWPWAYDYSGTYGDDGTLEPGASSAPVEWTLVLPARVSFSFRALLETSYTPDAGVIAGRVFVDADGDGRFDPAEGGIAGATVHLHHGDGSRSTLSGADGRFAFEVSEVGLYLVERGATNDCTPTNALERQVVIVQRSDGALSGYDRADFGCGPDAPPPIPVQGVVFDDLDRNGVRGSGEPGIVGARITGVASQCSTSPSVAHTGPNGEYTLALPACEPPYVIARDDIPGYIATTPNPVVIESGIPPQVPPPPPYIVDFGVAVADSDSTRSFQVVGQVYRDGNRNGSRDLGEEGVPNAPVFVRCATCLAEYVPVLTDANGFYRFSSGHVPWSDQPWVAEVVGREHCPTTPRIRFPGHGIYHADFGVGDCHVPTPISITGIVWHDEDRDGVRDASESGYPDAVVELGSPCEGRTEAWTDASGRYEFPLGSIPCQISSIILGRPDFWDYTTPRYYEIVPNLPEGTRLQFDFGVFAIHR